MEKILLTIDTRLLKDPALDALLKKLGIPIPVKVDTSQASSSLKSLASSFSTAFAKFGLVSAGISSAMSLVQGFTNAIIKPAAEIEQLRLRLNSLYGSTDAAAKAFKTFQDVATRTPATLQQVVQAGASLKAFGMDAENTLESVSDLAAYMGMDVVEAAGAVGRAFAGGAGAADILRERGVLELIKSFKGIDDLTKLTLPQFRDVLLETLQDPASGIAGSADKIAQSYGGAMSNLSDSFTTLRANIGSQLTPMLSGMANALSSVIKGLTGTASNFQITSREAADQRAKFESLVITYTNLHNKTTRSTIEQNRYTGAIRQLMELYPNYFKNIDLEKGKWENITTAIDGARTSLTNYLNAQLAQSATKDLEDKRLDLSTKIINLSQEMDLLNGEIAAGDKNRKSTYANTSVDIVTYGEYIDNLAIRIARYTEQEKKLETQIQARIAKTQELYKVTPPADPVTPKSSGTGGAGGSGGAASDIANDAKAASDQLTRFLADEQKLLELEYKRLVNLAKTAYDIKSDEYADAIEDIDSWRTNQQLAITERETSTAAARIKKLEDDRDAKNRKTIDAYNAEIERLRVLGSTSSLTYAEITSSLKSYADAVKNAYGPDSTEYLKTHADAKQLILDNYSEELDRLASLKTIGALTYDELTSKMRFYTDQIKAAFGESSQEYANALAAMQSAQLRVSETLAEIWRRDNAQFLDAWNATTSSLVAGFDTAWGSILDSSMTGSQRLTAIWDSMKRSFLSSIGAMASEYIKSKLTQLSIELTVEKGKQAAILQTLGIQKSSLIASIAAGIKGAFAGLFQAIGHIWSWWTKLIPPPFSVAAAVATGAGMIAAFNGIKRSLGFAEGGLISGPGSATSDSIPIMASNGEFVVNARATSAPGVLPLLQRINALGAPALQTPPIPGHYAAGGLVSPYNIPGINDLIQEVRQLRQDVYNAQPTIINHAPNPIEIHKAAETGRKLYKGY